jgi:hypothetical protein
MSRILITVPVLLFTVAGFMACEFMPGTPAGSSTEAGDTRAGSAPSDPAMEPEMGVPGPLLFSDDGNPLAKLTGDGPVLFRTDLEGESMSCWNNGRNSSGYAPAACGEWGSIGAWGAKLTEWKTRRSGSKAMSFTFGKNEDVAGSSLTLSANVVNVRAWYNFAPGFDFGQGIKIGRVQSFNSTTQMNDIDIVMTVRSSGSVNQCGTTDMHDMGLFFNGRPVGFDWGNITSTRRFERGRWYAIEYQVFLNTPGVRDGWVKIWVDGTLAAQKTGLNIRGNGGYTTKLNRIRLGGWYSNSANGNYSCSSPSQPSTVSIDDVAVGTAYIGPN